MADLDADMVDSAMRLLAARVVIMVSAEAAVHDYTFVAKVIVVVVVVDVGTVVMRSFGNAVKVVGFVVEYCRHSRSCYFRHRRLWMAVPVVGRTIVVGVGTVGVRRIVGVVEMVLGMWCSVDVAINLGMAGRVGAVVGKDRRAHHRNVEAVLACHVKNMVGAVGSCYRSVIAVVHKDQERKCFRCSNSRPHGYQTPLSGCWGRDVELVVELVEVDRTWNLVGCTCSKVFLLAYGRSIEQRKITWHVDRGGYLASQYALT